MQHSRRTPPALEDAGTAVELILEMDDEWEELDSTHRSLVPPKRGLFPPARTDAEISAIVDEFTDELCGAFY